MNMNFAFSFINQNRPDKMTISYDSLYSTLQKTNCGVKMTTQHDLNLKMLQQLLGSYKPDLHIVCEDEEIIKTYKLLLGLLSKQMGDIFLHEDFVTEPETTVIVPIHSQQMKLVLKSVTEGTEPSDALSQLFASHANNTILTAEELKFSEGFHHLNNVTKLLIKKKDDITDSDVKEEDNVKGEVNEDSPVLINFQINHSTESEIKKRQCPQCGRWFANTSSVNKHMREQCGKGMDRFEKRKCIHCNKLFRNCDKHEAKCLRLRKKWKKPPAPVASPCEECGKVFSTPYVLKMHMDKVHNPNGPTYYNCDKCVYRTIIKRKIEEHLKEHETGLIWVTCDICGKKVKGNNKKNLLHHIDLVHKKKYAGNCDICGKEVNDIPSHKQKMHSERKYSCHICTYSSPSNFNLRLHISKVHLGMKELEKVQCPHCDVVTTNLPHHLKQYHIDK